MAEMVLTAGLTGSVVEASEAASTGAAEAGCVIWICELDGKTFACRPRGTREEREELFEKGADFIGNQLTVRYQEKTDDGLLRFPVGIAIRNYE